MPGSGGASRLFFIHADHLARPQKITDGTRTIVWDGVFAPFGEVHAVTGSIVNVLMFPGQVYDPETGLAQNWHRDYDANIGRYLQSDPIGLEGGINTYAYVGGNPVARIDPTGQVDILPGTAPILKDWLQDKLRRFSRKEHPKEHCTRLYVRCVQEGWGGDWSCGQCHFYCTGVNDEWPFWHCSPGRRACYAPPQRELKLLPGRK